MFVIIQDNFVVLGPMRWNKFRFQNFLREECDVDVTDLPQTNESTPIVVNSTIKILPATNAPAVSYNQKTQHLHGPFWQFTDTQAIASYLIEDLPIDFVRSTLKTLAATERYRREIQGTKVTLNGQEISIATTREQRAVFVQQMMAMTDTDVVQWKFDQSTWMQLTKQDFQTIVSAINEFVQQQFQWEAAKHQEIDNVETLDTLDQIQILEPRDDNKL